jgi:hypothetical protein
MSTLAGSPERDPFMILALVGRCTGTCMAAAISEPLDLKQANATT